MKKLLITLLILLPLTASAVWFNPFSWGQNEEPLIIVGAPYYSFYRSLLPTDATENIGTTTSPWDIGFFNQVCLAGDCQVAWPAGGTGGTGVGTISTSTIPTIGHLPYWTSAGYPSLLGSVATGTVTCAGTTSCGAGSYVIGSNLTITGSAGGGDFAWTSLPWGNATSTTLGFLNGFLSTASSTISSSFYLPSLSQGFAYIGSVGKVNSIASSSIALSWFNNDTNFIDATGVPAAETDSAHDTCAEISGCVESAITGVAWGDITGTLSSQSDLEDYFIHQGTTSVASITTLGSLSLPAGQVTGLSYYTDADVSTYLTGGTGITESSGTISFDCSEVEGTGINCATEAITLDNTGAWAGTLSSFGTDFYTYFNATTTDYLSEGSTNKYWSNTLFDNRLSASTTINGITTLPNLSLPLGQVSGMWTYPFPSAATTTALTMGGLTLSNITGLTQCLRVNSSGVLSGTGSDCGAGGGGSTGQYWASTSPYTTGLLTYPVDPTSDIAFGRNSTTTAPFWWDVSATSTFIGNGGAGDSSVILGPTSNEWSFGYDDTDKSFAIASSTALGTNNALTINKSLGIAFPALSQGFAYLGSGGALSSIASSSINLSWFNNDSGFKTFAYPFPSAATSTLLTFSGGLNSSGGNTTIGALLGTIDAGGATSFEIPNNGANTLSAIGQVAWDTTDNQLLIATTTANTPVVYPSVQRIWSGTIASTSVDFVSGGRIPLPPQRDGFILKEIHCNVDGGTSKVINLDTLAGGANTDSLTCGTALTSDTAMSANYIYAAGSLWAIEFVASSGAVDYVTFSAWGTWLRE